VDLHGSSFGKQTSSLQGSVLHCTQKIPHYSNAFSHSFLLTFSKLVFCRVRRYRGTENNRQSTQPAWRDEPPQITLSYSLFLPFSEPHYLTSSLTFSLFISSFLFICSSLFTEGHTQSYITVKGKLERTLIRLGAQCSCINCSCKRSGVTYNGQEIKTVKNVIIKRKRLNAAS